MADMTETVTNTPKKVLPKLARVLGASGFAVGETLTLTYMTEMDGLKAFMVGQLPDQQTTTPMRMVRIEIENSYRPKDTVVATVLNKVNGEDMWAINPRMPKIVTVGRRLLMNKNGRGHLIYRIIDQDNPHLKESGAKVVEAQSMDEKIITAWADDNGLVRYAAHKDGETTIHLTVTTGTGQDFIEISVLVDSTLPQITVLDDDNTTTLGRGIGYTNVDLKYHFRVDLDDSRPAPEYWVEVINLDDLNDHTPNLEAKVDPKKYLLTFCPQVAGDFLVRLHITNAGKPCYAEFRLRVAELNMNE